MAFPGGERPELGMRRWLCASLADPSRSGYRSAGRAEWALLGLGRGGMRAQGRADWPMGGVRSWANGRGSLCRISRDYL